MDLQVLRNLSYGMYIISTSFNNELAGCVVNTVVQITSSNPIIAVSVNKNNYTNTILKQSKRMAISILSTETSKETITNFGFYSQRNVNKFKDNYELINEVPIIKDNLCGYLIGDIIDIIEAESHDIFLMRLTNSKNISDKNPMTYEYYQTNLKGKSSINAPTFIEEKVENSSSNKYRCIICGHIYDDSKEQVKFEDLPDDWKCPVCGVSKDKFEKIN
ncbi:MAG: flavin reductase [Bacilli bacterium]|nr:flavin reductase [Bacilli bacterium]